MAKTRAQLNRGIRQEALREMLAAQGHEQHIVELLGKIQNLDIEIDAHDLNRYKVVLDSKFKLLNKYLPDVRTTELTGAGGKKLAPLVKVYLDEPGD